MLGLVAGILLARTLTKSFHLIFDQFILMAAFAGLGGIVGAKILYILVSLDKINFSHLKDLSYLNTLMRGGFVFYGGLAGGVVGLVICKLICRISVWTYMKIYIPCLPLVHAFGRIGCALTGCCYGIPYDGPGAIIYYHSMIAPNKVRLFPVQLMETVINLLIAVVLLVYVFNRKRKNNHSIAIYGILYGSTRFILEFFRYDSERGKLLWFSTSQWISLILIGSVITYSLRRRENIYAG